MLFSSSSPHSANREEEAVEAVEAAVGDAAGG
jgi:hypothetical protein